MVRGAKSRTKPITVSLCSATETGVLSSLQVFTTVLIAAPAPANFPKKPDGQVLQVPGDKPLNLGSLQPGNLTKSVLVYRSELSPEFRNVKR